MSSAVWTTGIQLAMAFAGSLGFCMMFRLRAGLLVPASLGGLFCWAIYLTETQYVEGIFLPAFLASAFAATYAEVLARKLKAPATLFLIPAVVPLVPGSGLYYHQLCGAGRPGNVRRIRNADPAVCTGHCMRHVYYLGPFYYCKTEKKLGESGERKQEKGESVWM